MRKYEMMLLFSPDLITEDRQGIVEDLSQAITEFSGKLLETDDWGMRDLAYPVQKHTRGRYLRLVFAGDGRVVEELERKARIADGVMKFLTVKIEDHCEIPEEVENGL